MNPEERDSTIEFILRQQAQFSVDQENLSNNLQSLSGQVQNLSGTVQTLAEVTLTLMNIIQREHEERVHDRDALQKNVDRLDKIIEIQSRRLDRLEAN